MANKRHRDNKGRFIKSPDKPLAVRDIGWGNGGGNYAGSYYSLPKSSHAGIQVDELTALNLSAIWRGVNVLAGDVIKLPLNIYQRLDTGGKKVTRDNRIFELLNYPNRFQNGKSFRHTALVHVILWGNAYIEILRNEDGEPTRLELLDPRKVKPKRDHITFDLFYDLSGKSPYSQRTKLLPENVLHFKGLSVNGDEGLSPIQMNVDELGTGLALSQYAGTLFGNGAVPNSVIECPPGWDEISIANFRQGLLDTHQGVRNANRPMILAEGSKWVATSFNPEQLQMLNSRLFSVQEVGRILGLPPHKLGDYSHEGNRSLDEKNREYYQTSLEPLCDMIEEEVSFKLFTVQERRMFIIEHDMTKLTRATDLQRAQTNDILMRNGVLTANEWRSEDGRNPFDEDIRLTPMNMVQVESGVDLDPNPVDDSIDSPVPNDPEVLEDDDQDFEKEARAVLVEATRRMVAREVKQLKKAHKRSEVCQDWLEDFYQDHKVILAEALTPALRLYSRAKGLVGDPGRFLDHVVEKSKASILDAPNRDQLLEGWEQSRPEDLITMFIKEGQ